MSNVNADFVGDCLGTKFDIEEFEVFDDLEAALTADTSLTGINTRRFNMQGDNNVSTRIPKTLFGGTLARGEQEPEMPGIFSSKRCAQQGVPEVFQKLLSLPKPVSARFDNVCKFPMMMVDLLNGADFGGLAKVVGAQFHPYCSLMTSYSAAKLDGRQFTQFFEHLNGVHPDRILRVLRVHHTDKCVTAALQLRFTDCKRVYEAAARSITDPQFAPFFPPSRVESMKRKLRTDLRPAAERLYVEALLESDADLDVCADVQMIVSLDNRKRKIVQVQFLMNCVSARVTTQFAVRREVAW